MTDLVLIRGIPGSGKTTLANKLVTASEQNVMHFEADMFFEKDGEYKFDRHKLREAHQWCLEQTDYYLERGFRVIVSNTFTTKWEMSVYFDLAYKFCITPTVYTCQNDWGSIRGVPPETVDAMKKRFEFDISYLLEMNNE